MADYNVQMKQYNGTSFDNILPYASQALTLAGGGDATEIIAQARAGLSQIATGSYVGTGTYGQSNPTVINCGFKPKYVYVYNLATGREVTTRLYSLRFIGYDSVDGGAHDDTNAFLFIDALPKSITLCNYPAVVTLNIEFNETGISFYVTTENFEKTQHFLPEAQLNEAVSSPYSNKYYYVALG